MRAADQSAMHDFTVRFREPLRRFFARRLADSPDADDLVNEVFVRLLRQQERIAAVEHIEGYVFKIAWNVLRDRARRLHVRAVELNEPTEDIVEEAAFAPDRILIGREAVERLTAALQELPDKTRRIFVLYHFEGISQVEIARQLLISLSTVEKHMARANAKLLRRVGPLS